MFFAFADFAVPGKSGEKDLMDLPVEWRKLEPPFQIPEYFLIPGAPDEMLQQGDLASAESPPLPANTNVTWCSLPTRDHAAFGSRAEILSNNPRRLPVNAQILVL